MSRVSVVVPSIGERPRMLEVAVLSVQAQRNADEIEVLVVDASGEGRVSRAASLPADVTVLKSAARLTAAGARELGTRAASNDWVAYCDDDDVWAPDKIHRQLAALQLGGGGWSVTGAVNFIGKGELLWAYDLVVSDDLDTRLLARNVIPAGGSSLLVDRRLLEDVGGWDLTLRESEDWDLFIRLAREVLPAYVPAPLVGYRLHENCKSADVVRLADSHRTVASKYGLDHDVAPDVGGAFRRELLLGDQNRVEGAYRDLPAITARNRLVWCASRIAHDATVRAIRRRARRQFPRGWLADAGKWVPEALGLSETGCAGV